MSEKYSVYRYTRGDNFSVKVVVNGYDNLTYSAVVTPDGTTQEVKLAFLEEAYTATIKQLDSQFERAYSY